MEAVILLLAAGASTRMGTAKQLLPWSGTSLVRHAALRAVAVPSVTLYIVTGAFSDSVANEVNDLEVKLVHHPSYSNGLGASLAAGVRYVLDTHPRPPSHLLVQLADQPAVTTAYLQHLLTAAGEADAVVATAYGKRAGVPAVFPARYFPELLDLGGDAGAGPLLNSGEYGVRLIHPSFDLFDIDTPEDYRRHEGNP